MAEESSSRQMFFCSAFKDALDNAADTVVGDIQAAIKSTMNKVISGVKALTSAEIRKKYNVSKAVLDSRLTLFSARMDSLSAQLNIGGRSISLSYFRMTAVVGNRRSTVGLERDGKNIRGKLKTQALKRTPVNQGISVEVVKGKRTTLGKSAFVAVMKSSGHIGIMHRGAGVIKSRARYQGLKHKQQIYENSVVSIATMFNRADVNAAVVARIDADLETTFLHELEFFLSRSGK